MYPLFILFFNLLFIPLFNLLLWCMYVSSEKRGLAKAPILLFIPIKSRADCVSGYRFFLPNTVALAPILPLILLLLLLFPDYPDGWNCWYSSVEFVSVSMGWGRMRGQREWVWRIKGGTLPWKDFSHDVVLYCLCHGHGWLRTIYGYLLHPYGLCLFIPNHRMGLEKRFNYIVGFVFTRTFVKSTIGQQLLLLYYLRAKKEVFCRIA